MKNILFIAFLCLNIERVCSQAHYMHEASEDSGGIAGIIALVAFFGAIYLYERFKKKNKEIKRETEKKNQHKQIAISVSESSLEKYPDISTFQNNKTWRKGYINATYDIQHNSIKKLYGKSLEDLIREYKSIVVTGTISPKTDELMEMIGYFEHLAHNNTLLEKEGRKPFIFSDK
ncbi:hypothetical protein [Sphingobacterium mizutaii]|uniref:hypothetical protein n=1 Tax=Sphingobacterium mizutaii TaxID=1010 RepID=UPI00162742BA|nr:hypothetical protein [Sphingobacterium mizutaii]